MFGYSGEKFGREINKHKKMKCENGVISIVKRVYVVRTSWLFGDEIKDFIIE